MEKIRGNCNQCSTLIIKNMRFYLFILLLFFVSITNAKINIIGLDAPSIILEVDSNYYYTPKIEEAENSQKISMKELKKRILGKESFLENLLRFKIKEEEDFGGIYFSVQNKNNKPVNIFIASFFAQTTHIIVYDENNKRIKEVHFGIAFDSLVNNFGFNNPKNIGLEVLLSPNEKYKMAVFSHNIHDLEKQVLIYENLTPKNIYYDILLSKKINLICYLVLFAAIIFQFNIVNWQIWITKNKKEYLYYVIFLLTTGTHYLHHFLVAYHIGYLLPFKLNINLFAHLCGQICFFCYVGFARHFIGFPKDALSLNKICIRVQYIFLILTIIYFFLGHQAYSFYFITKITFILLSIYLLVLTVKQNNLQKHLGTFVVIGCSPIVLALILQVLYEKHIIYVGVDDFKIVAIITIIFDLLCFSVAFSFKIREMERKENTVREQIRRELHTQMKGNLLSAKRWIELLEISNINEKSSLITATLKRVVAKSVELIDIIIWSLQEYSNDISDLLQIMEESAKEMTKPTNIKYSFNFKIRNGIKIKTLIRKNLALVFINILNNTIEHSKARHFDVTIETIDKNTLRLILKDDGEGFVLAENWEKQTQHNGLRDIKQLIEEIGGQVTIYSKPQSGCCITCKIPNFKD